jgi:hypothetical protein
MVTGIALGAATTAGAGTVIAGVGTGLGAGTGPAAGTGDTVDAPVSAGAVGGSAAASVVGIDAAISASVADAVLSTTGAAVVSAAIVVADTIVPAVEVGSATRILDSAAMSTSGSAVVVSRSFSVDAGLSVMIGASPPRFDSSFAPLSYRLVTNSAATHTPVVRDVPRPRISKCLTSIQPCHRPASAAVSVRRVVARRCHGCPCGAVSPHCCHPGRARTALPERAGPLCRSARTASTPEHGRVGFCARRHPGLSPTRTKWHL